MRMRSALLAGVCFTFMLGATVDLSRAQGASALTGVVTSSEEGPMEGVLVTAKKAGSTIATTVVTGKDGRYSFPAARLEPGDYTIKIRAAGYDLDGNGAASIATEHNNAAWELYLIAVDIDNTVRLYCDHEPFRVSVPGKQVSVA